MTHTASKFIRNLVKMVMDNPHAKTKSRLQKIQWVQRHFNERFTITIQRGDKLNPKEQ